MPDDFEAIAERIDEGSAVPRSRTWLRAVAIVALGIACVYVVAGLIERIDWGLVVDAIGKITGWQLLALFGMLIVRQVLNARPLSLFLPELSLTRATTSDQAAALISMIAPPPSDMVLRIKIFHTWGIDPARGLAGATMNVLAFYINRLVVPLLGFLIYLVVGFNPTYLVIALVCVAAGGSLFVMTQLAARSAEMASAIGRRAGRLARRFKKSVDPEVWAAKILDFRNHIADRFAWAIPRALIGLAVMTVVDALIVVAALRFVGVPAEDLPLVAVVGSFLVLFPLTIGPLQGLGILDSALLAAYIAVAGQEHEAAVLAGLVLYRLITLGGPMLLGCGALVYWRRTVGEDAMAAAEQAAEASVNKQPDGSAAPLPQALDAGADQQEGHQQGRDRGDQPDDQRCQDPGHHPVDPQ